MGISTYSLQTPESLAKEILFFAGPVHFPVTETDSKQHVALNVPEFGLILAHFGSNLMLIWT